MDILQQDQYLKTLTNGKIHVDGQFMWGSNYTFLVQVKYESAELAAVYKPSRGERPLWDFLPGTLAAREVAAYLSAQSLGWDLVPPTVLRQDGPAGPGSVQLFVDVDQERHYFTFSEEERRRLRPVAVLGVLINNADRKGGHILLAPDDHIWLIDHGVCFHWEYKLRTVVWDFVGEPIPDHLLSDLQTFLDRFGADPGLQAAYAGLLSPIEIEALVTRAERLLTERRFQEPGLSQTHPWPLV